MSDINIDDALIDLQTRLAYQEDTITQLNEVVIKQDADIIQLQQQVRLLAKRVDESSFSQGQENASDEMERPPHY